VGPEDIKGSIVYTTVTGGYIYGFKPVNDALKSVIDRFKPVNVAPCDRSGILQMWNGFL